MEVAARDTRALASGQVSLGSLFGYARRLSNRDKPTSVPRDATCQDRAHENASASIRDATFCTNGARSLPSREALVLIHFVATHFSPSTGHPPCSACLSKVRFGCTFQNSSASPRAGARAARLRPRRVVDVSSRSSPRALQRKCVSPPASTSVRYSRKLAILWLVCGP